PTPKNEWSKTTEVKKPKNFALSHNAQLSSEQRNTKATALRHKHRTHCKPKLPRVANLLELFVMRFFDNAKLANENITLNTKNYKRADNFL
ncbi:hypothetical protein, partial [Vibrio parahaemolyticus]|uniref:hypothetical protein n=1 Tax=Vibrio parahaemolyticus TaxID=670 RepID=UPI0022A907BF